MSDPQARAIGTIRAEHRALAAVINNMKAILADVRAGQMTLDYRLFWSMVYYIDAFPDRLHHPKEDDHLFARLKQRTHEADALIAELMSQHQNEAQALGQIRRWLGNHEAGVARSLEQLERVVKDYAEFTWKHMRMEENDFMPLAEQHLTTEDWEEIARAFHDNADPLIGHEASEHFAGLFRDIVDQTPAPYGLG